MEVFVKRSFKKYLAVSLKSIWFILNYRGINYKYEFGYSVKVLFHHPRSQEHLIQLYQAIELTSNLPKENGTEYIFNL